MGEGIGIHPSLSENFEIEVKNEKRSTIALLLALVMLLGACGNGAKTEDPKKPEEAGKPEETGKTEDNKGEKVLTTLYDKQGEGTNFDTPWWNRGDLYKVASFRSFFKANADLTEFKEDMITDYKMSEGGLTYEFNLKDGLKWSDGKDLTAEDVKFSIEGALKGAKVNGIYTAAFSKIEGVDMTEYHIADFWKHPITNGMYKVDTKGAKFANPWFATDIGFENWELK